MPNSKTNHSLFIAALLLQGCSPIQNGSLQTAISHPDLNYLPIGIPFLLGGHGTGIPLTKNISITNDHVALVDYSKVIARHPYCDIALIAADNSDKEILPLGTVNSGGTITNYGYGFLGNVIQDTGLYHLDARMEGFEKCVSSLNDAAVKKGMSGGAVVNDKGELVGVLQSIGRDAPRMHETNTPYVLDRYTYFVPIFFIKDWLYYVVPELKTL